jgi:flagellin-like protein
MRVNRAVSPVISVILMVATVVILVATASVFIFGTGGSLSEPSPFVADTTGEFTAGADSNQQLVRITHKGGDNVAVEEIDIVVRASGPGADLPVEARLVDLPGDGFGARIDDKNIQAGKGTSKTEAEDLISQGTGGPDDQIIIVEDSNTWAAGDTIQFRVAVGGADFRDPPPAYNSDAEADTLEVIIIHTPSDAIISENTFTP